MKRLIPSIFLIALLWTTVYPQQKQETRGLESNTLAAAGKSRIALVVCV